MAFSISNAGNAQSAINPAFGSRLQPSSRPSPIGRGSNSLFFIAGALILICLAASVLSGCKTTRRESDLPWNERQSWEGGPAVPAGFGSR